MWDSEKWPESEQSFTKQLDFASHTEKRFACAKPDANFPVEGGRKEGS